MKRDNGKKQNNKQTITYTTQEPVDGDSDNEYNIGTRYTYYTYYIRARILITVGVARIGLRRILRCWRARELLRFCRPEHLWRARELSTPPRRYRPPGRSPPRRKTRRRRASAHTRTRFVHEFITFTSCNGHSESRAYARQTLLQLSRGRVSIATVWGLMRACVCIV